jgi:L-fuculose-phosphate aldolase
VTRLGRERQLIADYGRRLVRDGLVVGTYGNLSIRTGDAVAITPSAVDYDEIEAESVCVVDLDGNQLEGPFEPSTELPLHLAVHRARGPGAAVHAHAPYSSALSCVIDVVPAIHYLVAELGGPVRTAPYAPPGSERLGTVALDALDDRTAALLQSHGTLTVGDSLERAYSRTLVLEYIAQTYWLSSALGKPAVLADTALARLVPGRNAYGAQGRPHAPS